MNDATELSYAIELFKELLRLENTVEDHRHFFDSVISEMFETLSGAFRLYAVSFSEMPDDLTQWKAYSGGLGGYAIGFNFAAAGFGRTMSEAGFDDDDILLAKVIYDRSLQIKLLKGLISRLRDGVRRIHQSYEKGRFGARAEVELRGLISDLSSNIIIPITDCLIRFKHPKFASEKEWRLIRYIIDPDITSDGHKLTFARHYRIGKAGLSSYVELRIPINKKSKNKTLPIKVVWQGPNSEPKLFASLMRECLVSFGYGKNVEVLCSQVPTRF